MWGEFDLKGWALRAARPLSALLIGGAVSLATLAAPALADSNDEAKASADDADCSPGATGEKSIVIALGELDPADPSLTIISDQDEECGLEPIARTSGAEPELAMTQGAAPTLADPQVGGVLNIDEYGDSAYGDYAAATEDEVEFASEESDDMAGQLVEDGEEVRAASFNGVTPGVSTREDLVVEWGEPAVQNRGRLTYKFDNFPRVDVEVTGGVVANIRVALAEPVELDPLVEKLGMSGLRPAVATDEAGAVISTTFPERGVTLLQQPEGQLAFASDDADEAPGASNAVYEIELAGITAAPFLRRALAAPARAYGWQLSDLEQALKLDGDSAETRFYLSQVKQATASAVDAEKLAAEAVELDESSDAYRLHWARCLKDLAQYDAAVEETRKVLESPETSKLVRAEALNHMGRLAALGSRDVQARAVPLHTKAIELADQLANDPDERVSRAANLLLIDAHLAMAERLVVGDWQDKDETIAQWIARASAIAERMIADGEADESLRLKVAVNALQVGAKLDPPINPELWIAEAEEAAALLDDECDDDLAVAAVDWQLALAYCCATEIQHRRGEPDAALAYGDQAEQLLATLATSREELPDTGYVQGRLFFQIGAVHAVHRDDHHAACKWYKRALEPLLTPTPVTAQSNPGQHGDALVSMGVSYWNEGQRDRAYDLTEAGLELIRIGVEEGMLDPDALNVPESNLAAMGKVLGKVQLTTPTERAPVQQVAKQSPTKQQPATGTPPQQRKQIASRRMMSSGGTHRR